MGECYPSASYLQPSPHHSSRAGPPASVSQLLDFPLDSSWADLPTQSLQHKSWFRLLSQSPHDLALTLSDFHSHGSCSHPVPAVDVHFCTLPHLSASAHLSLCLEWHFPFVKV